MKFSNENISKILKLHDILNSIILSFYTYMVQRSEVIRRSFSSLRRDKDMYCGETFYLIPRMMIVLHNVTILFSRTTLRGCRFEQFDAREEFRGL